MQTKQDIQFFLGANTPDGFYDMFDQLVNQLTDDTLFILKGGPGCGKSSFLYAVAAELDNAGVAVEFYPCSADPGSLDAIYIPALKIAYADGTAPHVIEPKYTAVMEEYLDLGVFYDAAALKKKKVDVIQTTKAYKAQYVRAYSFIRAAHHVVKDLGNQLVDDAVVATIKKRARGIISREIGKTRGTGGTVTRRFLTAVSPHGVVTYWSSVENLASRVYHLDNLFGLSHYLLEDVLAAATSAGHDVIACPSPLDPTRLDHLLIPGLDLAFVSSNYLAEYTGPSYRHIRLDAIVDTEKRRSKKAQIRFSKKMFPLLLDEAIVSLSHAKALHDELEKLYNPHVSFDGVYALAKQHSEMLLARI